MTKRDYSNWTEQQLIDELHRLNKRKKFGLVWEERQEDKSNLLFESLALLKRQPKRDIVSSNPKNQNCIIVGENLHSLSILNYTHSKSFDVIYIDPPYNTGKKDFIFNDQFVFEEDSYRHSKWLSFMQKRLKLAKDLLAPGGLIFISIDDNEYPRLALLADEVFGPNRRIGPIIWFYEGVNDNTDFIKKTHEYVLCYSVDDSPRLSKSVRDNNVDLAENITNSVVKNGPKNPPSSIVLPVGFPASFEQGVVKASSIQSLQADKDMVVENYRLTKDVTVTSGWSSKNILEDFIAKGFQEVLDTKLQRTFFQITRSGNIEYVKVRDSSHVLSVVRNLGTTQNASEELREMGLAFSFPKPVGLISYLLSFHADKNARILDFFAGSGTTGQATLELNRTDGGNRSFVLCTSNEGDIAETVCYPRICNVIRGWTRGKEVVQGFLSDLRYFEVSLFGESRTDASKKLLTQQATDVLCLKEGIFDNSLDSPQLKIFFKEDQKLAVLFEPDDTADLLEIIENDPSSNYLVYVFSLSSEDLSDEFARFGQRVKSLPVPEGLLNSYTKSLVLIGAKK